MINTNLDSLAEAHLVCQHDGRAATPLVQQPAAALKGDKMQ
jgi:hypothetical protein